MTGSLPSARCVKPFSPSTAQPRTSTRGNGSNDWNPSRMHSIEEVPIALGFLVVTGGDYEQSIFGGANYGRDCDSIAGMAGSIAGALHGAGALRDEWIARVNEANRVDIQPLARDLALLVSVLHERRMERSRTIDQRIDCASVTCLNLLRRHIRTMTRLN